MVYPLKMVILHSKLLHQQRVSFVFVLYRNLFPSTSISICIALSLSPYFFFSLSISVQIYTCITRTQHEYTWIRHVLLSYTHYFIYIHVRTVYIYKELYIMILYIHLCVFKTHAYLRVHMIHISSIDSIQCWLENPGETVPGIPLQLGTGPAQLGV